MDTTEFRCEATKILSELRPNATLLTVRHYMNNFGEICDFSIVFHINYHNAIQRSLDLLSAYTPKREDAIGRPYTHRELEVAKAELLSSFKMTLAGNNTFTKTSHVYSRIDNGEGVIPGIKLHDTQDIIHLTGFRVWRMALLPGNYPPDNRASKTIAKDDLRRRLPIGRYVQFKLTPGKFRELKVSGMTIKVEDVVRDIMNNVTDLRPASGFGV